jgi:hypothetical protein
MKPAARIVVLLGRVNFILGLRRNKYLITDNKQWLAEFNGLSIFNQYLFHDT